MKKGLIYVFVLMLVLLFQARYAQATSPGELSYCGGDGQRGCCVDEASPSCDSDYVMVDANTQTCGNGIFPTGVCYSLHPEDKSFCGGNGQRACCAGEAFPSCDGSNVELDIPWGVCGDRATFPGASVGRCWTPTPCGAEGQRACMITEQFPSCNDGLVEITGCPDSQKCGLSSGFCYKPTPCGANGQRACCLGERATSCDDGLTEAPGVAGDATCGIYLLNVSSSGTCVDTTQITNNIAEPSIGWTSGGSSCSSKGYADLHVHMFADLAHGGGVLAGTPYDPVNGVNGALKQDFGTNKDLVAKNDTDLPAPSCDPNLYPNCGSVEFHTGHGLFNETIGFGTQDGADSNFGSPVFNAWPTWTSTTHQQMYYKWLERAWRGGLRLMVQHAVTNEALCKSSKHLRNTDCADDMTPIDAQIDAAYAFEQWLDTQYGGPGNGWYRIVKTPAEARLALQNGNLAVVLGIETANLFNCKATGCSGKNDGETDDDYVKRKVDEYYDKGVRVIFPIHNFDNGFGGPATWQNMIAVGNRVSEGAWWTPEECPAGYGFALSYGPIELLATLLFGIVSFPADWTHDTSCNTKGLSPLGTTLITYMMQKGIIVDVDHMSNYAFEATLDLADSLERPVIASHVQFYNLNQQSIRHERMRTPYQLARIKARSGMIAAMLKDDQVDTDNKGQKLNTPYASPSGTIADDCRNSSKTFAQMYQYAVDQMQGPVAFGSDFNGVAGHVGPRFGSDGCGNDADERGYQALINNRLQYPFAIAGFGTFDKQVTGLRTFDFNVDGFAHIGLYPDMIAEMKQIGLTDAGLDPLFNSAVGFVDVWDRANGNSNPGGIFSQLGCQPITVSADSTCQASGLAASIADAITQTNFGPFLIQTPAAPYSLGVTGVTLTAPPIDACAAAPGSCGATVQVVDTTGPNITCPQPGSVECIGTTTPVTFSAPLFTADNCTAGFFAGCTAGNGSGFPVGSTQVTCKAYDLAINFSSCSFNATVVDTTVPEISCPEDQIAECTGNHAADVTPDAATGSDICGNVDIPAPSAASYPLGTTPVNYTATDQAGLEASCTSDITVQDTTAPQISCPANTIAECTGNHAAVVTPNTASGSDICGAVNIPAFGAASYPLGTTPITHSATDDAALQNSCTSYVVVQDTTLPQISCPEDIVVECAGKNGTLVTPGTAVASDVCGSASVNSFAATQFPLGTTTLTYLATDQVGLQKSCTSNVIVGDTKAPSASLTVSPSFLEEFTHKMKEVTIGVRGRDVCDSKPVCQISKVTSSERVSGLWEGDNGPDWAITGPLTVKLRKEHGGKGDRRTYEITVTCGDKTGNQRESKVAVPVLPSPR